MSKLSDDETVKTSHKHAGSIKIRDWGADSNIGLVRKQNEDSWGERDRSAFVVADGMGGTSGGALASSLAVAGFLAANPHDGWLTAMRTLSRSINATCTEDGYTNAGTTLVGVFIDTDRCVTISIGDSRIYRRRQGTLENLTIDHNLGNLRRAEGQDADYDDGRGRAAALTSFLGSLDHDQPIDVRTIAVQDGDRLLLCSDGIHGQGANQRMLELTDQQHSCDTAAELLTAEANGCGGRDNATALIIDMEVRPT